MCKVSVVSWHQWEEGTSTYRIFLLLAREKGQNITANTEVKLLETKKMDMVANVKRH